MNQIESRKDFLRRFTYIIPSIFAVGIISKGCNTNENKTIKTDGKETGNCDDLSDLSDEEISIRKKFNYVEAATVKNKSCQFCKLYIPAKSNSDCGTCMLIKGPVRPGGTCTYWAPKADDSES